MEQQLLSVYAKEVALRWTFNRCSGRGQRYRMDFTRNARANLREHTAPQLKQLPVSSFCDQSSSVGRCMQVYKSLCACSSYDLCYPRSNRRTDTQKDSFEQFLANLNSRSRSLYAVARPAVCRLLSVCL